MKLYIKPGCPWCTDAVRWLDREGYKYETLNVLRDGDAYARMREISGQSLTPTLEIGEKVLPDFDTKQLERFMEAHNIHPE